jgi:predicted CXXCH cytochrome family protein
VTRLSTALLITLGLLAVAWTTPATSQESSINAASQQCMGCHDFGPESPAHKLMEGSHGGDAGGTANEQGCAACHGSSVNHASAPTRVSPDVSFGPRWSASTADQDKPCLECHEENVAAHWKDSLHMFNNLSCVTCHDVHTGGDKVLFPAQQPNVCTVCHKAQKQGVHGMEDVVDFNPACSSCHNPHDHESAETAMLENGSMGCRGCHDLVRMAGSNKISDKAKQYHQLMSRPERTCVECHGGIAHAGTDSVTAFAPTAVTRGHVTLFYPGHADSEWLLQQHPGSQPLRQGTNCRQCHRGEEADMGRSRAGDFEPAHREIELSFIRDKDSIRMVLSWRGERDETDIALMWGTRSSNSAFSRGGCFAACHSDLPGMSRDRGQQTGKYLWASRVQQQGLGKPAIVKDAGELEKMMAAGRFAVLWRIQLNSGKAEAATLLDDVHWQPNAPMRASTSYQNGHWTVKIRRDMRQQPEQLVKFSPGERFTFGIALHGKDNPGADHWVSLPLSLSYDGDDTDFKVE